MTSLITSITEILGADGRLAHILNGFEFRSSQILMASTISEALHREIPALLETGTGTGKTLAYLVPIFLSGKKAVISTGTKNLQDQIFFKDIPLLERATGCEIKSLLMKGRKNYLCLHRYHQFFAQRNLADTAREETHGRIEQWLHTTVFADRAEIPWLADDDPLWDMVSADSDQCLGMKCGHQASCFLDAIRKKAGEARIIVVNHHLFFADLMLKQEGFGEIIPRFQVAVFDEAHTVEEVATTYMGMHVSTGQLVDLTNDLELELQSHMDINNTTLGTRVNRIRSFADQLHRVFMSFSERGRIEPELRTRIDQDIARHIRTELRYIGDEIEQLQHPTDAANSLLKRANDYEQSLERIFSCDDTSWLDWYERKKRAVLIHTSPLDISLNMKDLLYKRVKTVIFTSATLTAGCSFHYIRSRLGIADEVAEVICPSPFDFSHQTLFYVPLDLPDPTSPLFGNHIASRIENILYMTTGRALILFTSHMNLNFVYQALAEKLPYPVLKQGDAPRSILLDTFRHETQSILFATGSFWQGIDVPGEALSCVIIDKLPFDSPLDPLVAARIEAIRSCGGNPFFEFQLPSAIISLKQGVGRLIRRRSDRGVIALLDKRIIFRRYGRFVLESLPDFPLTHTLEDIQQFFDTKETQSKSELLTEHDVCQLKNGT